MQAISTNHFKSFAAACRYCSVHNEEMTLDELANLVRSREVQGDIVIGPPELSDNEEAVLVDDCRYVITLITKENNNG